VYRAANPIGAFDRDPGEYPTFIINYDLMF